MATHTVHNAEQLSAHLRSLRKSRRLTQAQLGASLGLDQTRIAKIERNPGLISVEQLLQILAALETQVMLQPRDRSAAAQQPKRSADW